MNAASKVRLVLVAFALVVCGLGLALALAEPAENEGALDGGKVSPEEVARIGTLSVEGLADTVRTGTRGQKETAIRVLLAQDKRYELLSIAKGGPQSASDVVVELFTPQAEVEGDAMAKQLVDEYITFLEEQLKAGSPVVSPAQAVRSLARVVYRWEVLLPGRPMPEPFYGYKKVVGDLISLLDDKRAPVGDAAASWLGAIGGYTAEQSTEAVAALGSYRQTLAASPVGSDEEAERKQMRLAKVDEAIKRINREQGGAENAATEPAPPSTSGDEGANE